MNIKIVLDDKAFMPCKAHSSDGGFDIKTPINVVVKARKQATIRTGVYMAMKND